MTIKQEVRSSETQIVSPLFLTVFLTVFYILLFKPWERWLILNLCFPCKKTPYYFFFKPYGCQASWTGKNDEY